MPGTQSTTTHAPQPRGTTATRAVTGGVVGGAVVGGVARGVGLALGTVAAVRRAKPLHPRGVVHSARLRRYGSDQPWGVPWLDGTADEHGVVRLSRSAGLPAPLPDVLGLALRVRGCDGRPTDVLLSTTGLRPIARHVLLPRTDPLAVSYGSLLPYRGPRGPVLLAATPEVDVPGSFRLSAARPTGHWRPFALLELGDPVDPGEADPAVSFDPVLHPVPGLEMYDAVGTVRRVAYRYARAGRRAPAGSLEAVPCGHDVPSAR